MGGEALPQGSDIVNARIAVARVADDDIFAVPESAQILDLEQVQQLEAHA